MELFTSNAKYEFDPNRMYIFLDYDGVLNGEQYRAANGLTHIDWDSHGRAQPIFHPENAKLLNILLHATEAHIILSTSWRIAFDSLEEHQKGLRQKGVEQATVVAATPRIKMGTELINLPPLLGTASIPRSYEIMSFLRDNPAVKNYVIFDDEDYAGINLTEPKRFIQTDTNLGLTPKNIKKALEILEVLV